MEKKVSGNLQPEDIFAGGGEMEALMRSLDWSQTLLVVNDDDSTLEFLAFLLELRGADVTATASASEALTVLIQFKPDILLSDMGMPDVDGTCSCGK